MASGLDRPMDRDIRQRRRVRDLFQARIPWLSAAIVVCVVGFMSWATAKAVGESAGRRAARTRGSISYEDAVAASLRGEAVIVDARPRHERRQDPVPGGAIIAEGEVQPDSSTSAPGGMPEDLLESLRDVPLYVLRSGSIGARALGLRIAPDLRKKGYQVEFIKAKP